MIDTHCHLTDPHLLPQIEQVMSRAAAAGVTHMVTIGTGPPEWEPCLRVCRQFPNVRCALGVHPNYCDEVEKAALLELRSLQADPMVVALGEMGLDYHYDDVPKAKQLDYFQSQLAMAVEFNRPVVIHSRKSMNDCLAAMKDFALADAVFHCFSGSMDEARRVIDAGYYIGFTGVVTFKKCEELRQIAQWAPASRILVETDAPYLSPEPMRKQKICEPALVVHTAAIVAAARGVSTAEIDHLTSENAMRFYRWNKTGG